MVHLKTRRDIQMRYSNPGWLSRSLQYAKKNGITEQEVYDAYWDYCESMEYAFRHKFH